eukprot:11222560-Lingulodinium_polyedra.AAC.1
MRQFFDGAKRLFQFGGGLINVLLVLLLLFQTVSSAPTLRPTSTSLGFANELVPRPRLRGLY